MTRDAELDRRLADVRQRVAGQQDELRRLRRRLREAHATASALVDEAVVVKLRSQGLRPKPPVPSYPPHGDDG